MEETSRREFLAAAGLALPTAALASIGDLQQPHKLPPSKPAFTYRVLGKTGLKVTSVGFGCMITSDQSVIDRLEISQSGRWYQYKARVLPLPQKVIAASSSNMHMIPADDDVAGNVCLHELIRERVPIEDVCFHALPRPQPTECPGGEKPVDEAVDRQSECRSP